MKRSAFIENQTVAGKIKLKFLYNLQIEKQLEMSNKKLCFGERFCYPLRFLASRFFPLFKRPAAQWFVTKEPYWVHDALGLLTIGTAGALDESKHNEYGMSD